MQKIRKLYADSIMELKVTKNMVICAFMAALAVVLSYTTSIEVGPYIRIGFSGLPNRIVEFLFGPITGCIFGGALQLIPVNIIAYRSQYGSVNPAGIIAPAILATLTGTLVAVFFCKWKTKAINS